MLLVVETIRLAFVYQTFLVDLIVMEQRAARRFDHADAYTALFAQVRHQIGAGDFRIVQQFVDRFGAMQGFDHARPVIGQRVLHETAVAEFLEALARRFRQRR